MILTINDTSTEINTPTRISAGVALVLIALLAGTGAPAQAWEVRRLEVEISVLPDARIRVVETIHANFGPERERGITRIIPLSISDPSGYRAMVDARLLAVTDAAGARWPSRVTRTDRDLQIWIGARDTFVTGEQIYALTYEVDGAILGGPTRDELYWQVTGYQWDVPIIEAEARVELPPGVDLARLDASSVIGKFGAPGRPADMRTLDAARARFIAKRGLVPREGFLVSVVWPAGLVEHPGPGRRALRGAAENGPYVLVMAVALAVLVLWRRRRRAMRDSATGNAAGSG